MTLVSTFDAILLDLRMPHMNGVAFIQALRERPLHRASVVTTADRINDHVPIENVPHQSHQAVLAATAVAAQVQDQRPQLAGSSHDAVHIRRSVEPPGPDDPESHLGEARR